MFIPSPLRILRKINHALILAETNLFDPNYLLKKQICCKKRNFASTLNMTKPLPIFTFHDSYTARSKNASDELLSTRVPSAEFVDIVISKEKLMLVE